MNTDDILGLTEMVASLHNLQNRNLFIYKRNEPPTASISQCFNATFKSEFVIEPDARRFAFIHSFNTNTIKTGNFQNENIVSSCFGKQAKLCFASV